MDYQVTMLEFLLQKTQVPLQKIAHKIKIRLINNEIIVNSQSQLTKTSWQSVYNADNVNITFYSFYSIFLRNLETCFPFTYVRHKGSKNSWLTHGIKISCRQK